MSRYRAILTRSAQKDLDSLDIVVRKRIAKKIVFFAQGSHPLKYAVKLTNFESGSYRYRIGKYRAIFDLDEKQQTVIIARIEHRRSIYR